MARQVATAYTGANVSLFIGGTLLTNVFGVSWELSQSKRPIYGYNSMYFDAIATGQVLVLGQLYVNYQHPNSLSNTLNKLYNEKKVTSGNNDAYISKREAEILANIKNNIYKENSLNSDLSAEAINEIFNNPRLLTSAEKILGAAYTESMSQYMPNLEIQLRSEPWTTKVRPDQFSSNQGLRQPIDIIITHGDPNLGNQGEKERVASYNISSTIALRNVHFLGESQQIMSDDQPVMEVYKFMARSKETVS